MEIIYWWQELVVGAVGMFERLVFTAQERNAAGGFQGDVSKAVPKGWDIFCRKAS